MKLTFKNFLAESMLTEIAMQDVMHFMQYKVKGSPEWKVDKTGRVEVFGDVQIERYHLQGGNMPFAFGRVHGDFEILPEGKGNRSVTRIRSGLGFPTRVDGAFVVHNTDITTMKHFPEFVGKEFIFTQSRIETLDYLPVIGGSIDVSGAQLKSLKGLPKVVNGYLGIGSNKLTSISGISDIVEEIHGFIHLYVTALWNTPLLGLVAIKHLKGIVDTTQGRPVKFDPKSAHPTAMQIVAKYVEQGDNDVIGCQSELLEHEGPSWDKDKYEKAAQL